MKLKLFDIRNSLYLMLVLKIFRLELRKYTDFKIIIEKIREKLYLIHN